jgi:uncharacterized membrane protein (DUF485 family)
MAYNRSKNSMKTNELLENTGTTQTDEQAPVQSIEVSEKAEKLMKKSVRYLTILLWTVICFSALAIVSNVIRFFNMSWRRQLFGGSVNWAALLSILFMVVLLVVTIIKIYAYLGDYKIFIKHKSENTLDDLLDAQRGFYGWIILMPLILLGISLLLFLVGGILNPDFTENDF